MGTKVGRRGLILQCRRCGDEGHNARKCKDSLPNSATWPPLVLTAEVTKPTHRDFKERPPNPNRAAPLITRHRARNAIPNAQGMDQNQRPPTIQIGQ
ncbi:hypothetical protein LINGRAHAP2_LOCUS24228 [Linum grandiflorum]